MKKGILVIFFVFILIILLNCGCTEKNNEGNTRATITMTGYELNNDMIVTSNNTSYSMLYTSLKDGDILQIKDNISNIQYDSNTNITTISFEWSEAFEHGTITSTRDFQFQGNLTEDYSFVDYVNITTHIKHVSFSTNGINYDLEIYGEQWINQDYFTEHVTNFLLLSQGLKPLPRNCIMKISESQNQITGSIKFFNVNPTQILVGETAILSWNVTGANTISIDNGIGTFDPVGSFTISPTQTTTYTLTADYTAHVIIGSNKASVTIEVSSGLPIIITMEISNRNDETNTITWEVTNIVGGPVTDSDVDMFIVDESDHIVSGQGIEHTPGGLITQGRTFIVTAPSDGHYIFKITEKGLGDVYFQSDLTKY